MHTHEIAKVVSSIDRQNKSVIFMEVKGMANTYKGLKSTVTGETMIFRNDKGNPRTEVEIMEVHE